MGWVWGDRGHRWKVGAAASGGMFSGLLLCLLCVPSSVEGLEHSGQGSTSGGLVCSLPLLPAPSLPPSQPTLVLLGSPVLFKHVSLVLRLAGPSPRAAVLTGSTVSCRGCVVLPWRCPLPCLSRSGWPALPRLQRGGEHAGRKGLSLESWKPACAYLLPRHGGCRTRSSRIGAPRRATLRASGWGRPGSTGYVGCPWQEDSHIGRGVGNHRGWRLGKKGLLL